jgi:DoxX-like family
MNLALWVAAIVLAAAFAGSGLMKQFVPKDKLVTSGQGWAQDFSPTSIRLIGLVEVLGAAGLILPAITHIAPILVPLAAIGLALVMVGAAICSCPAQRTNERHRQHRAAGAGRLRCLGQARLVYLHVLADANV